MSVCVHKRACGCSWKTEEDVFPGAVIISYKPPDMSARN